MAMCAKDFVPFISRQLEQFFMDIKVFMHPLSLHRLDLEKTYISEMRESCEWAENYCEILIDLMDKEPDYIFIDQEYKFIPRTEENEELADSLGLGQPIGETPC